MVRQTTNLLVIPLQSFVHSHTLAKTLTFPSCTDFAISIRRIPCLCLHFACNSFSRFFSDSSRSALLLHRFHFTALKLTLHPLLPHLRHSKSLVFLFYELLFFPSHTPLCAFSQLASEAQKQKIKRLGTIFTNTLATLIL